MSKSHSRLLFSKVALPAPPGIQLVCRVDNLLALRTAVDNGADAVRLFCNVSRNGAGLSTRDFLGDGWKRGIRLARGQGCNVSLDLIGEELVGTNLAALAKPLERAIEYGIDSVGLSSPALILYARTHYPFLQIRFIAPQSVLSPRALGYAKTALGFTRVVLPRVISMAQLRALSKVPGIELEVICHGRGCAILAGVNDGLEENSRGALRATISADTDERCGDSLPASNDLSFSEAESDIDQPDRLLPELKLAGIKAVIVEAPHRATARIARLTHAWRKRIDAIPACPPLRSQLTLA